MLRSEIPVKYLAMYSTASPCSCLAHVPNLAQCAQQTKYLVIVELSNSTYQLQSSNENYHQNLNILYSISKKVLEQAS